MLDSEIGYLASSDVAFQFRKIMGKTPGVSSNEMVQDVAEKLKIKVNRFLPIEQKLQKIVTEVVNTHLKKMKPEDLSEMIKQAGVNPQLAKEFVEKNIERFTLPIIIQILGVKTAESIIKNIVIGMISKYIGKDMALKLIEGIAKKFPIWADWIGPVIWAVSISWTVLDLQGPAYRKTIPVVLYLGLCAIRLDGIDSSQTA